MLVERRLAHVGGVGQCIDGQRLVEVLLAPRHGPGGAVALAVGGGNGPQARPLFAGEQAVQQLALVQGRQHRNVLGRIEQPGEA